MQTCISRNEALFYFIPPHLTLVMNLEATLFILALIILPHSPAPR